MHWRYGGFSENVHTDFRVQYLTNTATSAACCTRLVALLTKLVFVSWSSDMRSYGVLMYVCLKVLSFNCNDVL